MEPNLILLLGLEPFEKFVIDGDAFGGDFGGWDWFKCEDWSPSWRSSAGIVLM